MPWRLHAIAAEEEICIVSLPPRAGRIQILLFVGEHKEIDQITLEELCVEHLLNAKVQEMTSVPNRLVRVDATSGSIRDVMVLRRLMKDISKLLRQAR
jgi:hypothetical protein